MTRQGYARLAGFMFIFYIAAGLFAEFVFAPIAGAEGVAGKLAAVAEHASRVRLRALLSMILMANAVVLGVALYAITRDQDRNLALMAVSFRVLEAALGAAVLLSTMGLLSLATSSPAESAPASTTLAAVLFKVRTWGVLASATAFAAGSLLFSWLFVRARSIPAWLAWLGVVASVLVGVVLPLQLVGWVTGPVVMYVWLPMLVFELVLGIWLLVRGVGPSTTTANA
jgi:hypothetical protein